MHLRNGDIFSSVILSICGILCVLLLLILVFFVFVVINSPGKLRPIFSTGRNSTNIIAEKRILEIGGMTQGMFLSGTDIQKPILLFLHGGPGSPIAPLMDAVPNAHRIEQLYTVCYWEQRGAGLSYSSHVSPQSMTIGQMLSDAVEVTHYLRARFQQDKIYCMGYSWGSYLGIQLASKHPELFHAYIGIGQVTNQNQSEFLAYNYLLTHAKALGDTKATKTLLKFAPQNNSFPDGYILGPRTKYLNKYCVGMQHRPYSMLQDAKFVFGFKGYTFVEKIKYLKGFIFSLEHLEFDQNLFQGILKLAIPTYFMEGQYDYQVSSQLAQQFCDTLIAPQKKLYLFANSAHSPMIEEPEAFLAHMQEILNHTTP